MASDDSPELSTATPRLNPSVYQNGLRFPALAIIINNYYLTNASHPSGYLDVFLIVRVLKRRCIPYILVDDCTRQELQQIVEYVEGKDLNPIKLLMLLLMSHGGTGDVFYTSDGHMNISEVVSRLAANQSLKDAGKLVLVTACHGDIDLDLYSEIENTQSSIVDRKRVMYSVPNGVQLIREIPSLERKINRSLSIMRYYEDLNKCSDLLEGDSTQSHGIVSEQIPAVNMLQLFRSIQRDFPLSHYSDYPKEEDLKEGNLYKEESIIPYDEWCFYMRKKKRM